ncbi:hypothetical protein DPV78_012640 [Talaromyces pinophilus]|nr:hypothetical protein DPV78_012640 [Talaromyces pinophilus]
MGLCFSTPRSRVFMPAPRMRPMPVYNAYPMSGGMRMSHGYGGAYGGRMGYGGPPMGGRHYGGGPFGGRDMVDGVDMEDEEGLGGDVECRLIADDGKYK